MKVLFSITCWLIFSQAFTQNIADEALAHSSSNRRTGIYLLVIFLIVTGINLLVTRLTVKKGAKPDKINNPGLWNFRKYSAIFLWLAIIVSQVYQYWYQPHDLVVLVLFIISMGLMLLVSQYFRIPDWVFRHRSLYTYILFLVLTLGIVIAAISSITADLPDILGWIIPIFVILCAYFVAVLIIQQRKWNRFKLDTPYPGEKKDTISAHGAVTNSVGKEANHRNEGRILLFPDQLIFVAEDGTVTPILFNSIQKVSVHKKFRFIPAGLELIGFDGQTRLLMVGLPYYWKHKMEAKEFTGAESL